MSDLVFDISNIKDNTENTFEPIPEGRYKLVIEEVDVAIASTGTKRLVVHYNMPEIKRKLKYDSMSLVRADGSLINFGILKAKKLAIAAGVMTENDKELDIDSLKKTLIGKTIEADVEPNEQGFGEIKGANYYVAEGDTIEEIEFDF